VRRDRARTPKAIPACHLDGTRKHEVCGSVNLSELEHDLMGAAPSRLAAEAARDRDLR
jgi:hypothetical protein